MGSEKQACLQLMRKFIALEYSDTPLRIKSAVALDNIKGQIYVEAHKSDYVQKV
eukprot:Awhi_evm1s2870